MRLLRTFRSGESRCVLKLLQNYSVFHLDFILGPQQISGVQSCCPAEEREIGGQQEVPVLQTRCATHCYTGAGGVSGQPPIVPMIMKHSDLVSNDVMAQRRRIDKWTRCSTSLIRSTRGRRQPRWWQLGSIANTFLPLPSLKRCSASSITGKFGT